MKISFTNNRTGIVGSPNLQNSTSSATQFAGTKKARYS